MIDIHTHIIPGIDDGPATMDESMEMARIAVDDGIETIVATPHCFNGIYHNRRMEVLAACEKFSMLLHEHDVPLSVLPGSEAHLGLEILDELAGGGLMTINDKEKYLSLELPDRIIPDRVIGFINRLRDMGLTPILSHPERNPSIQNNPGLLRDLISAGALSQITADSLTGGFGSAAARCCREIIEQDMMHVMATDAHSSISRAPVLSVARDKLALLRGKAIAEKVTNEIPRLIIAGELYNPFWQVNP